MQTLDKKTLELSSPLAWVLNNDFVNENDKPLEFSNHRFLIDPFTDLHPNQVCMKSAQIGWSVMSILKTAWLAKYYGLNCIYVLPTNNVVKDFVAPKVDPLITKNKAMQEIVSNDSVSLKKFGDRFIYYRGSFSEREAIAITADLLVIDELDRCMNQAVLTTYQSRLQASEYAWQHRFSNPSVPGFGVHSLYQQSDQMHWFVKCNHCNHEWFLTYEDNIDEERQEYICSKCKGILTDDDRRNGRWVAKHPTRSMRGYWISQLIVPYVSAKYMVEKKIESTPEFFHNFVLGLPYVAAELMLDRQAIIRANSPGSVAYNNVCMGIDNGIVKSYVIGTPNGIFEYGETESWEELEQKMLMYDATVVIDANPYPAIPKKLAQKYPGKVFINYYIRDRNEMGIVRWLKGDKFGVVHSDRTKIIDWVVMDINNQEIMFTQHPHELEKLIYHCENVYRIIETDSNGVDRGKWVTKEGKPDHFLHAICYYRIALSRVLGGGGYIARAKEPGKAITAPTVDPITHTVDSGIDIEKIIKDARKPKKDGWHV